MAGNKIEQAQKGVRIKVSGDLEDNVLAEPCQYLKHYVENALGDGPAVSVIPFDSPDDDNAGAEGATGKGAVKPDRHTHIRFSAVIDTGNRSGMQALRDRLAGIFGEDNVKHEKMNTPAHMLPHTQRFYLTVTAQPHLLVDAIKLKGHKELVENDKIQFDVTTPYGVMPKEVKESLFTKEKNSPKTIIDVLEIMGAQQELEMSSRPTLDEKRRTIRFHFGKASPDMLQEAIVMALKLKESGLTFQREDVISQDDTYFDVKEAMCDSKTDEVVHNHSLSNLDFIVTPQGTLDLVVKHGLAMNELRAALDEEIRYMIEDIQYYEDMSQPGAYLQDIWSASDILDYDQDVHRNHPFCGMLDRKNIGLVKRHYEQFVKNALPADAQVSTEYKIIDEFNNFHPKLCISIECKDDKKLEWLARILHKRLPGKDDRSEDSRVQTKIEKINEESGYSMEVLISASPDFLAAQMKSGMRISSSSPFYR